LIDDIDRKIVTHLQTDGRMPYSQLVQLVGLSDAAARQRVNRLTERGVIDIVAVTDPKTIGLGYQAMLGITITADARSTAEMLGKYPSAVYVVMTTGRYDIIVEVLINDGDAFLDLIDEIRTSPGIASVEVLTYLGVSKQTFDWGVR
jgi:Lrp/AsnC family transcriptional regulator, regulator for asnA, asnC and gidA